MKQRLFMIWVLGIMLMLTACELTVGSNIESIEGSGNVITSERDISGFSQIQIYLGADLALTQGDSESLIIESDNNILEYIETEVRDDTLIISKPDNINLSPSQMIQLYVTFDTLTAIDIFGCSIITGSDLTLDELAISFFGSGSTHLTGTVDEQFISIYGQAMVNNFDLNSRHVTVGINGNGTIEVNAEESLDITVAGMGSIHYRGNPTITQDISGMATVIQHE